MAKSKDKIQLELKHHRVTQIISSAVSVIRDSIKWGSIGFIFYCGYLSISVLAGKTTQADINVSFFESFAARLMQSTKLQEWIQYVLIIAFALWGIFERRLRGAAIERLTSRIHQLELQLDPKRTSSRLTSTGQTRPGDEQ